MLMVWRDVLGQHLAQQTCHKVCRAAERDVERRRGSEEALVKIKRNGGVTDQRFRAMAASWAIAQQDSDVIASIAVLAVLRLARLECQSHKEKGISN